jgi:hypothetical protein
MIDLKFQTIVESFESGDIFFDKKIIFSAQHSRDKESRNILPTICLVDFQTRTITYYVLFLKENIELLQKIDPEENIYKLFFTKGHDTHSYVYVSEFEFMTFFEMSRFYFLFFKSYAQATEQLSSTNFSTQE